MVEQLIATTAPAVEAGAEPKPAVEPFSLASRAMLVYYTKNGWTGLKRDRTAGAEVARLKRSNEKWGHYTKSLVAKEALKRVQARCQDAYEDHLARTLPWLNDGTRLLTAKGIKAYEDAQAEHVRLVEEAKDELEKNWAGYKEQARLEREGLGELFDERDYPTAREVRDKFQIGYRLAALPPDVSDFRVDVGDETLKRIKERAAQDAKEVLLAGQEQVLKRIIETVGHMADGLGAFKRTFTTDAQGKVSQKTEGIFRDSLVGNVRDLSALLESLNITDNARLASLAQRINQDLTLWEPESLKADDTVRAQVAAKAGAIREEARKIASKMDDFV